MKKVLYIIAYIFIVVVFAAGCSKYDNLSIIFEEGNQVTIGYKETIDIHYIVKNAKYSPVINVEVQDNKGNYFVGIKEDTPFKGIISITASTPTEAQAIVSVSDGYDTISSVISIGIKPDFDEGCIVINITEPGTLAKVIDMDNHYLPSLKELTVTGKLNLNDISQINKFPDLSLLDLSNADIEGIPNFCLNLSSVGATFYLPDEEQVEVNINGPVWTLWIPANVQRIDGIYATNTSNYTIYCTAITPPSLQSLPWWGDKSHIFVPLESIASYKRKWPGMLNSTIIEGYDFNKE